MTCRQNYHQLTCSQTYECNLNRPFINFKNLCKTGQGRSSPAPPIYPFTIPPEGGQGNHGYHGYQETENNQDALKV